NAAGYLSKFRDYSALEPALTDRDPLVRATAALRLNPPPEKRGAAVTALTHALADPSATVQVGAAVTLVSLGVVHLEGADGERFDAAQKLFRARALLNNDDAASQLGA